MQRSRFGWGLVLVCAVALLVFLMRGRIHFDVPSFLSEVRHVSGVHLAVGVALIYVAFSLRAMRWAIFLRQQRPVGALELLGAQFIGFTAVGLFGRLADLSRPYLIAKRTKLSVSSQVAVYTVERMFDLGAAALIFSTAVAFMPKTPPMPHAEVIARIGRGSLLATLALAVFVMMLRVTGEVVARLAQMVFGVVSKELGARVAETVRGFRDGLRVLAGWKEFGFVAALSLGMWGLIAMAYVESVHAFVDTPQLAAMSFAQVMLLMASSIGASVVQLPVIGWFTQIGVLAAAMNELFGVRVETATACGAMIFGVCSLSVIPMGLIWAQVERVSLRSVAEESAAAGDTV